MTYRGVQGGAGEGKAPAVLNVLLVTALVVSSIVAARRWLLPHLPATPRDQVDAFTRARAVTQRWAEDPQATPAPLKEYLARQRPEADEAHPE